MEWYKNLKQLLSLRSLQGGLINVYTYEGSEISHQREKGLVW